MLPNDKSTTIPLVISLLGTVAFLAIAHTAPWSRLPTVYLTLAQDGTVTYGN